MIIQPMCFRPLSAITCHFYDFGLSGSSFRFIQATRDYCRAKVLWVKLRLVAAKICLLGAVVPFQREGTGTGTAVLMRLPTLSVL